MPSASSSRGRPSLLSWLGLFALGVLLVLPAGAGDARLDSSPAAPLHGFRTPEGSLEPAGQRRLRASAWLGGAYTASTGESVRVLVSEDYLDGHALGQKWADFLASLLHGRELGVATTYVVTPAEIGLFCGPHALGCYGGNELVFMGETVSGVTPEEVARHEYGHHVAANRPNPPWLAVDWGPKRWASAANICRRAQQGAVFPGDEDAHYELNPGEGFAEVYRVANELRAGAGAFSWFLVDPSFSPDAAALQAAEQDVVAPWSAPVSQRFRGRFVSTGRKVWKATVATTLDGSLSISLSFPRGALHELEVVAPGGRVVAKGLWAGRAEKRVTTTVCGERSLVLRVTRRGPAGPFAVRVTHD